MFELGIWDKFIEKCDVTISRTVAEQEVVFASKDDDREWIDLSSYEKRNAIRVVDLEPKAVQQFLDKFDLWYKADIHVGEKEALAFINTSSQEWKICASDGAVFRVLGLLGKGEQGISLEELLKAIGLGGNLEWQYTKKFRDKYTTMGQIDATQGQGLV